MFFESLIFVLLLTAIALLVALLGQGRRRDEEVAKLRLHLAEETRGLFGQLEAYLSLRDRLGLREGLPYTHQWSAAPDFLKLIVEHALTAKPARIVECSSGLTSLMLARCCEMNGQGEVLSLENGAEYAERSRAEIKRYRLASRATILDAPLENCTVDGSDYQWYTLDALPELPDQSIDMLVIDGPPGFIQRHSRYPALPLLFDKLADGCVVFLDDAGRPEEREIVEMWKGRFPGSIEHQYIGTERGCSILRIHR